MWYVMMVGGGGGGGGGAGFAASPATEARQNLRKPNDIHLDRPTVILKNSQYSRRITNRGSTCQYC